MHITYLIFICLSISGTRDASTEFDNFSKEFDAGYAALQTPFSGYDYRDELRAIPGSEEINRQMAFLKKMDAKLQMIARNELTTYDRLQYDHLAYEMTLNQQRLQLASEWPHSGQSIPEGGLSSLAPEWYAYRIARFTSIHITPEELYAFGEQEVMRVSQEIRRIRNDLGYGKDSVGFYKHLQDDSFILKDKSVILQRYKDIHATVMQHLSALFTETEISDIEFMEWPGADQYTPPGYYSPSSGNTDGLPVFHFNFYQHRHNTRSMEWLFLHEAVPGHHYQWSIRDRLPDQPGFKRHFSYSGNFEGWAAYIEYYGKTLGLYRDPYSELGKWEWDLVRSVRILIDVGIHHKGWSHEEALACWRKYIQGQDDIAEREVTRCTNWPGQALSYKVGSWKIQQMADAMKQQYGDKFSLAKFHNAYLGAGQTPLMVIEANIASLMASE